MADAEEVLREKFGFETFREGQEAVISCLLAGRSAAAIFPTGSGKSLCYQLPALMLPGITLVVSPLIALMKDQLDYLTSRQIAAARLDSSLTAEEYREVMTSLRAGSLKLLYIAPERFNNERFRRSIESIRVSLFAVDEAHCVSEWGHNFRPDYLKLAEFAKECRAERILALTATATPKVIDDIRRVFSIDPEGVVRTGFYRPNLTLRVCPIAPEQREEALIQNLKENPPGPTIVYVTRQKTSEELAKMIEDKGFSCKAYHAGMTAEDRAAVQDWFMTSEIAVVVATIAFGMGVDKKNIRYIYHYNLPKSLESYAQEIGRAGRDNEPSLCQMFVCPSDLLVLENFAFGDTPTRSAIAGLITDLFSRGPEFSVSHFSLSYRYDIKLLVVRTLLTYLELDGYLRAGTPFYSRYRFKPLVTSQEILGRFEGERQSFLRRLLSCAVRAKTWFDIDLDDASKRIPADRNRIVKALDYLAEQEMLELSVQGIYNPYTRLKSPESLDRLISELYQKAVDREEGEIARLRQVMALAEHDGCLASYLGAHFGEPLDHPCCHCSSCLDEPRRPVEPCRNTEIDSDQLTKALALFQEHPDVFTEPRTLTRFLAGVASPATSRARLGSHPQFGMFAEVPFGMLLDAIKKSQRT